jgi:hypothetical protein
MGMKHSRLPPGRQPYDMLNGFRIGALAGGLMGALGAAVTNTRVVWVVLVGAAAGAVIGYWTERRRRLPRKVNDHREDELLE